MFDKDLKNLLYTKKDCSFCLKNIKRAFAECTQTEIGNKGEFVGCYLKQIKFD